MKILCIYHGNCADGFGAAWAVRHGVQNLWNVDSLEFHPGVYQQQPPDVTGKVVVIVDFSYKRPVIEAMSQTAQSILILDHHKSAAEDLAGLPEPPAPMVDHLGDGLPVAGWLPTQGIYAKFDMTKSGAMLAWEHFNGGPPPGLIHHIQDRDLWRFKLPGTREIQATLFSYPYDFDVWDALMKDGVQNLGAMITDGQAIERKHFKDINELIASCAYRMVIAEHDVPVLNCPYFFGSDACAIMAKGQPFAAYYWDTPDGRTFGLRSAEDGMDVSEIAKKFGGGGHKHAAGFRVALHGTDRVVLPK